MIGLLAAAATAVGLGAPLLARRVRQGRRDAVVSVAQLRAIMPELPAERARAYQVPLVHSMREWGIESRAAKAAFLAQLAFESAELRRFLEGASGVAYEGRENLGNVRPGDGVRFKGRGPIQLTGRANYRAAGKALGLPLEERPELVERPRVGFRVAGWFWHSRGLTALAERGDFREVTRRINGGFNGLAERERYWRRARVAFGGVT